MGKKLVIKGANFSENGFVYQEVITDASQLYYNNSGVAAELTAEIWASLTSSQGYYASELNTGKVQVSYGVGACALAVADCEGYEKVTVKTICNLPPQSTWSNGGAALLMFVDASGDVVGGITTMAQSGTSPSGKTTGAGYSTSYRSFELAVPDNATKVYSVFKPSDVSTSPWADGTKFEMKLIKHNIV